MLYEFCSKFHRYVALKEFWRYVKFWPS